MNQKLLAYRKMIGLTQKEMAAKADMSTASYNSKEQGKSDFTQSEMETITLVIQEQIPDVTMDDIFFRKKVFNMKTVANA